MLSNQRSIVSTITFDSPYGFTGKMAALSRIGEVCGMPYTAAVEENTRCFTPARSIAIATDSDPAVLFSKYISGACIDSPTEINAAK